MKRSEMLKRLKFAIELDKQSTPIEELVLTAVENCHMLPPAFIPKGNYDIWDSICEWEPEDHD